MFYDEPGNEQYAEVYLHQHSVSSSDFTTTNTPFADEIVWIRIIVIVTCVLSICGSALIIFSFACFKELRTWGRQILVHISIMDFGVAAANLVGAAVYFDRYYHLKNYRDCNISTSKYIYPPGSHVPVDEMMMCPDSVHVQILCIMQAFFSLYFTYGSILWTNSLSFYLYFRIVHNGTRISNFSLYFLYIFCYGMPLLLGLWLTFTGRLGVSPYESSGWCSIILENPATKERDIFVSIIGYDLWIVLSFILIPLLSIAMHQHVRREIKTATFYRRSDRYMLALRSIDYKFLLIPVVFIFLRFWSFIGDILHVYHNVHNIPKGINITLTILEGIGDSGQGFTNGIIFVLFTKRVRDKFLSIYVCSKTNNLNIQNKESNQDSQDRVTPVQHDRSPGERKHSNSSERQSLLGSREEDCISPSLFTSHSYEPTPPPTDENRI